MRCPVTKAGLRDGLYGGPVPRTLVAGQWRCLDSRARPETSDGDRVRRAVIAANGEVG